MLLAVFVVPSVWADNPTIATGQIRVVNAWTNTWYGYDPDADAMYVISPGQTVDVFPLSVSSSVVLTTKDPTIFAPGSYSGGWIFAYPASNSVLCVAIVYSLATASDAPQALQNAMLPALYANGVDPLAFDYGSLVTASFLQGLLDGGAISVILLGFVAVRWAMGMVNDGDNWE